MLIHFKTRVAGVAIVNLFHFFDRIKEANDEGRAKGFPRLNGSAAEFLDQADITALVTIDFAKALDISIPEGHRALTRWKDVVSSRSSMSA